MNDVNPRAAEHEEYRKGVRELCARFDSSYWQRVDKVAAYPEEFVSALTEAGCRRAHPHQYGGGLSLTEASVILEESISPGPTRRVPRADVHHGDVAAAWLARRRLVSPQNCLGRTTLQSFAVTGPAGTDTTKLKTFARKDGDRYVVNGQKVWISRIQHSDLMLLLARTTPGRREERMVDCPSSSWSSAAPSAAARASHPEHGER